MVADKQHSRSIGPMVNLTQPAEGRSRDGGLRYGGMEAIACAHMEHRCLTKDVYDASDSFTVHICKDCGLIAAYNDKSHIHHCKVCDNRANFYCKYSVCMQAIVSRINDYECCASYYDINKVLEEYYFRVFFINIRYIYMSGFIGDTKINPINNRMTSILGGGIPGQQSPGGLLGVVQGIQEVLAW